MDRYYMVEAAKLPEIFLKVARAKELLDTGEAATVNEATVRVGISRSAFYKYRDSIMPVQNLLSGRILTFQLTLRDQPGLLSALLSIFAKNGVNILTINQTIPTGGCAGVTVSAETFRAETTVEGLLTALRSLEGVLKAELLAG